MIIAPSLLASDFTRFGREVLAELNRTGTLLDLSHSGERTCLEAIAASGASRHSKVI